MSAPNPYAALTRDEIIVERARLDRAEAFSTDRGERTALREKHYQLNGAWRALGLSLPIPDAPAKPKATATHRDQNLVFSRANRQGRILEFVLAPREKMDGWFGLGRVHLVGGSSGAGKTTLITKALMRQQRGEVVFGHQGLKRRPLVLFADRGTLSNDETLFRLRIDKKDIPIDYIPRGAFGLDNVQAIIDLIEQNSLPDVVFIEGADTLVENQNKPEDVVPFMQGLQSVAEHYHIALILSVGAPKLRNGEKHQAQRDLIIGSEKWARMAEDVLTLEFVSGGNGTENDRTLTVQHRNAVAEKFKLAYAADGSELTEKTTGPQDDAPIPLSVSERRFRGWLCNRMEPFKNADVKKEVPELNGRRRKLLLDDYTDRGLLALSRDTYTVVRRQELAEDDSVVAA